MTFKSKQFSKYCACWGKLNKFEVSFVDEFHRGTFLTSRASEMIDRLRYAVINCKRYIRKTLMESWRYPGKFTGGFVQFYLFYGIAQFSLLDIDIRMKNKKEKEKAYRSHRWKLSVFFFFFFQWNEHSCSFWVEEFEPREESRKKIWERSRGDPVE